jgi:hypothetical protein
MLTELLDLVLRDEARHVAFGVSYMEQFVKTLSPRELEERALFAFEACRVMRERIVPTDVFEHYGWDADEGRRRFLAAGQMDMFRNLLFTRIMPNLNKVGLLPESMHAKYDELGLMQFEACRVTGTSTGQDYRSRSPATIKTARRSRHTAVSSARA